MAVLWRSFLFLVIVFCSTSANGIKFPWLTRTNFHRPLTGRYFQDNFDYAGFDDFSTQHDAAFDDQLNEIPRFEYPAKIRKYWAFLKNGLDQPKPQDDSVVLTKKKKMYPDVKESGMARTPEKQYAQLGPPVYEPDEPIFDTSILEKLRKIHPQRSR